MVGVGIDLAPERAFLELLGGVLREAVDYFEITPETTWWCDESGALGTNGYHRRFAALVDETGRPCVAHGVGLSLGSAGRADVARRRRWLGRIAADHRRFKFRWYTEHLGITAPDGAALALPLPLPMDAQAARVVRRRLFAMQQIVPDVGVENSVQYFLLGNALDEAGFLGRVLRAPRTHLLLDLHNVYANSVNFKSYDRWQYLRTLPLSRVVEIHIAGGQWLEEWYHDLHNHAVPEPVWEMLAWVLERAPNLRAVCLEVQGPAHTSRSRAVGPEWLEMIGADLDKARALWDRLRRKAPA